MSARPRPSPAAETALAAMALTSDKSSRRITANPKMTPRVFTIPASAPFLPTLIEALTSGKLGFAVADDPLVLASATLYLPTRRACRLMRDAFLDARHGDAAILPRIIRDRRYRRRRDRLRGGGSGRYRGRRAGCAARARSARAPTAADAVGDAMGQLARTSRHERHAAGRTNSGGGVRSWPTIWRG